MKDLEEKLGIFICSHKDFIPHVSNETGCYRVAFAGDAPREIEGFKTYSCKPNIPKGLDDKFYSELYMMRYLVDNVELPEWVGICHYRRYWHINSPKDIIDTIDNNGVDLFVRKPMRLSITNKELYQRCHNVEDLNIVGNIIGEKFPGYKEAFDNFLNASVILPFNMVIMRREDFIDLVNFQFAVLDEYLNVVGTDINKRIEDNKDVYLKKNYPNNTPEYQYRIGGYIGERLTNVFISAHLKDKFKLIATVEVDVTEGKYGLKF